ncbi:shikimate kinase [Nonomuraea sp. NPDC050556]|uniref:shikimate kinase n=1 Tax=Nonomuraea sp. NPDC050556 TaxID=3364369 RepID=UPI0037BD4CA3
MGKNKHVVLIGLMGSGKSTVARLVSRATGLPVSDSDTFLRERYGHKAAEIAATQGVDVLHEREAEHVLDALDGPPAVITAASSVVERPEVREALRDALVVWLDAPDEVLAERMKADDHRPPFAPALMRARREPYFRALAGLAFHSGTPGEAAATISRHLS